jgi:hypothetical protein
VDVPDTILFGLVKWPDDLPQESIEEYMSIIRTALADMEFVAVMNGADMPPIQSPAMRWALIGMSMAIPAAYEAATGMSRDWYAQEAKSFLAGWMMGVARHNGEQDNVAALADYDEWKEGSVHDAG